MEFRESDKLVEFFTINTKLSEILASKDLTVLGLNLILDQENLIRLRVSMLNFVNWPNIC